RREPVARDEKRVVAARALEPRAPRDIAAVPDDGARLELEPPPGDPRAPVEVDVLLEGEVALVVAAAGGKQLAAEHARRPAHAKSLTGLRPRAALACAGAALERAPVARKPLPEAVDDGVGVFGVPGRL